MPDYDKNKTCIFCDAMNFSKHACIEHNTLYRLLKRHTVFIEILKLFVERGKLGVQFEPNIWITRLYQWDWIEAYNGRYYITTKGVSRCEILGIK